MSAATRSSQVNELRCLFPLRRSFGDVCPRRRTIVHAVDAVSFALGAGRDPGAGRRERLRQVDHRAAARPTCRTRPRGEIRFAGAGRHPPDWRRAEGLPAEGADHLPEPVRDLRPAVDDRDRRSRRCSRSTRSARRRSARRGIVAAMENAGLVPAADFLPRYPHELSGGQLQRIATVRAMLLEPQFLVADEPVSMLDVSVRADILNQLLDLRDQYGMAILFITHDIAVARYVASRIAVMYLGTFVEIGHADEVIDDSAAPLHDGAALAHAAGRRRGGRRSNRWRSAATRHRRSTSAPAAASPAAARLPSTAG